MQRSRFAAVGRQGLRHPANKRSFQQRSRFRWGTGVRLTGGIPHIVAMVIALAGYSAEARDDESAWRETLEQVRPSVVSLRVNQTRPFDTAASTQRDGTGFVVDAKRGLILTNRHIVSTGPVTAEALFANQEEVELERVYADPVHDFGFFRYDPERLRYIRPAGLPLAAEGASMGREIRVIGNDAGERFSILAGTIARLDRAAPDYGFGRYNDFNTFYIQAASSTSGGSSGSPVIDIDGRAVALNAGGHTQAAASYFLPLDRVVRALEFLRQGKPVPRGGLLTTFEQLPYDELRRLGLSQESEAEARAADPQSAGLLVVRTSLPDSPAAAHLRPGDILVRIGDRKFPDFLRLEGFLDDRVGETVEIGVERQGEGLEARIEVADLHRVTPAEYVTFGGTYLHRISYQQARHFNVPLDTIYVAAPGYMLGLASIRVGSLLREINGHPLHDLDDVEQALAGLGHGDVAQFRFSRPRNPRTSHLRSALTGRSWFGAERCRQGVASPEWTCHALASPSQRKPAQPRTTRPRELDDPRLARIAPSMVHVKFDMPFVVSGVSTRHYRGAGLIVDAERGWVVVDRHTVPETTGDAVLTFNGTMEVAARVAHIHPVHNLALLQYDPAPIAETPVRNAEFAPRLPRPGEDIYLAGLRQDLEPAIRSYVASDVEFINLPLSNFGAFRESNLEYLAVDNADEDLSGVLLNSEGEVCALWVEFQQPSHQGAGMMGGLPIEQVQAMLDHLRRDAPWRSLEVEWQQAPLSAALQRGLPEDWRKRVEQHDPERRQMLEVARAVAGAPAADVMRPGDLLLTINGHLATRPREVEQSVFEHDEATVVVWRNGQEVALTFDTVPLDWGGMQEALLWAGALLQNPQRGMAAQLAIEPQGVAIQRYEFGSPAARYLAPARLLQITHVNGMATPDLETFAQALKQAADGRILRVEGISTADTIPVAAVNTAVATMKQDLAYWPSYRLRKTRDGWDRVPLIH